MYKTLCMGVFIIYFIISIILTVELCITKYSSNNLKEKKPISEVKSFSDTSLQLYYPTNSWMFNNRVYQYSSLLIVKNGKPIRVESMILTRGEHKENSVKKNFRCIVKSMRNGTEATYKVTKVFIFVSNAKRVKCDIEGNKIDFDDIAVAIINLSDFKIHSKNLTENDLGSLFFKLPRNMLHFQIPRIVFKNDAKIQKVSHCVHYSYNIVEQDLDKIVNWLEFQKKIGVDKVVFYDANIHKLLEEILYKKFGNNFVDIRPYHIHFEAICDFKRLNYYKELDLIRYQAMKDQCEDAFYNVFNNPIFSAKNRWNHQKITSNDCYSSLEQTYQFVAYYDFDEIIYPRGAKIDNSLSVKNKTLTCETSNVCSIDQNASLDLYEYVIKLIMKKNNTLNQISTLYFLNGFYLETSYYINKLMMDLNEAIVNNVSYFQQPSHLVGNNTALKVHLNLKHKHGHYFIILPGDLDYIKHLYDSYLKMKCISDTMNERLDKSLDSSFKRFLFLTTDHKHQMGKSIHNTDNVDAVFTHYATITKPGTKSINVKIDDGVLSHFRNDLFHLARQLNSSITNLKLDAEYYIHLLSHYSEICAN